MVVHGFLPDEGEHDALVIRCHHLTPAETKCQDVLYRTLSKFLDMWLIDGVYCGETYVGMEISRCPAQSCSTPWTTSPP